MGEQGGGRRHTKTEHTEQIIDEDMRRGRNSSDAEEENMATRKNKKWGSAYCVPLWCRCVAL